MAGRGQLRDYCSDPEDKAVGWPRVEMVKVVRQGWILDVL